MSLPLPSYKPLTWKNDEDDVPVALLPPLLDLVRALLRVHSGGRVGSVETAHRDSTSRSNTHRCGPGQTLTSEDRPRTNQTNQLWIWHLYSKSSHHDHNDRKGSTYRPGSLDRPWTSSGSSFGSTMSPFYLQVFPVYWRLSVCRLVTGVILTGDLSTRPLNDSSPGLTISGAK